MQGFIAASLPWRLCREKNFHHIHYCSCSVSLSNNIQNIPECLFNCTCARIICTCSCKEQHCNTQGTATGWHQEQIATNPTTGTLQSISQWFFCPVPVLPAFLDQTLDVCRSDPPIHPRPKAITYFQKGMLHAVALDLSCLWNAWTSRHFGQNAGTNAQQQHGPSIFLEQGRKEVNILQFVQSSFVLPISTHNTDSHTAEDP